MKVLITGSEGYIGSRLAPWLLERGHDVRGLDTGYYRDGCLYMDPIGMPRAAATCYRDLRDVRAQDLEALDAVVHMAELSNDPLGQNHPEVTFKINHQGSVRLARLAREAGVRRFVYTSSCSVYGVGTDDLLDETAPTRPQTAYAQCKVLVEQDLRQMAAAGFCVTFLRNATAYGPSPRMRFDIVLNDLCAMAWTRGKIAMTSDGSPWRPLVHVEDICTAVACALEAPAETVNAEIFNVGQNSANYRVRDLARIVESVFEGCEVTMGRLGGDNRSYRVCFDKIHRQLPGFACRWDAHAGAVELRRLFERIDMPQDVYEFRAFTRLQQLKYLQKTRQIDSELYWSAR